MMEVQLKSNESKWFKLKEYETKVKPCKTIYNELKLNENNWNIIKLNETKCWKDLRRNALTLKKYTTQFAWD